MIEGPPWVGKTVCAAEVFESLENSAWLDGDDVWQVNPLSTEDPRIRKGDKNVSFVLNTYLELDFNYVVYSSVLLGNEEITNNILDTIGMKDYDRILFMLICTMDTLKERSVKRDGEPSPGVYFLNEAENRDAVHLDTTISTPQEVAGRILDIVLDPAGAGLASVQKGRVREWKSITPLTLRSTNKLAFLFTILTKQPNIYKINSINIKMIRRI